MNQIKELNKRNYELSKKLNSEYENLYIDIVGYIRFSSLTERQSEEAINDILDIMLGAQERGEDVFNVINDDYKKFCDDVIEAHKDEKQGFKNSIVIFEIYVGAVILLIFIDFISQKIDEYIELKKLSFDYSLSLTPIILAICSTIIAVKLLEYLGKHNMSKFVNEKGKEAFKTNLKLFIKLWIILSIITALAVGLMFILNKVVILSTQFYVVILPAVILYFTSKYVSKKYA